VLPADEVLPTLEASIDIDNIPQRFGGNFVFEHGMTPSLDIGLCQRLDWAEEPQSKLPPGPLKWVEEDGLRKAVAIGTINGKARKEYIASLTP
jgi:hypothetical protein